MVATPTRRPTRYERDAARRAAEAAHVPMDLRPVGRASAVVLIVVMLALAAAVFAPGGGSFGGPLQSARPESAATFTVIPKTHGDKVTFGIPIPWNVGPGTAVLESVAAIDAEGVEVVRAAVVPLGSPPVNTAKGFPPPAAVLEPIEEYPIPQGSNDLDGFQVVVGLSGAGTVPAFALVYRVDGARHVAVFGYGVMLCERACEGKAEAAAAQRSTVATLGSVVDPPPR